MKYSPEIVNEPLCRNVTPAQIIALGFTQKGNDSDDSRDIYYEFETSGYRVSLDCVYVVHLSRKNPDTDHITVVIETLFDLECLLDWIAD